MTTTLLDRPGPIVDDATRQQFLAGLAGAGLLAGCGSGNDDSDGAPAGDGAFPVKIDHQFGRTVIPQRPTRVLAAGFDDQDFVLALGVTPVGVRENYEPFEQAKRPGPRSGSTVSCWRRCPPRSWTSNRQPPCAPT